MGVVVPAGEHAVTLAFRPRMVPWLLAVSVLAVVGMAAVCVAAAVRKRSPTV
jgi:hypothetical protein